MTGRLTCFLFFSQNNLKWVLDQLQEATVWTKNFKRCPDEDDDIGMTRKGHFSPVFPFPSRCLPPPGTGEDSRESSRVDEDPFEKQMCHRLVNEQRNVHVSFRHIVEDKVREKGLEEE